MDQSANKEENSNLAKQRRRRNDQHKRDFSCGCGKSYLSYAALYTHLKQKHDSKAPIGTQQPNNLNIKPGRGRPKRPEDTDKKSGKSDDGQSESENEPDETLEEMMAFLDSLGSFRSSVPMNTEQEIQTYLLTNFPSDVFNKCSDYQTIQTYIKEFTEEKIKDPEADPISIEEFDKEKSLRRTKINKILAYFLISIGPKLSVDAYREMVIFIIFLQKSLNTVGYSALSTYQFDQNKEQKNGNVESKIEVKEIKEEGPTSEEYCDTQSGEHMLLIANEFILQFLPQFFQGLGIVEKDLKIFGSSDEKLKNAVYVTQHLSYWLYSLKFTNSRLALYTDDE